MVRIVKQESPAKFSTKAITVLNLLGVVIADHADKVKALIEKYGIPMSDKPSVEELTEKALVGIEKQGPAFHEEVAKLIMAKVGGDNYDSFLPAVGAISGVLGSVAGVFGKKHEASMMRSQAQAQTTSAMFAYRAEQERAAAQAAMQQNALKHKQQQKEAMYKTVGMIGLLLVVGIALFFMFKPTSQVQVAQ